jgi:hypothetical protein
VTQKRTRGIRDGHEAAHGCIDVAMESGGVDGTFQFGTLVDCARIVSVFERSSMRRCRAFSYGSETRLFSLLSVVRYCVEM